MNGGEKMIVTAVQKGGFVEVYGEGNRILFSKHGDLQGYTGSNVSIREGNYIYVYNQTGAMVSSHYSPRK